jgi:hypothetical protein
MLHARWPIETVSQIPGILRQARTFRGHQPSLADHGSTISKEELHWILYHLASPTFSIQITILFSATKRIMGDFGNSQEDLSIGEIRHICWNETGQAVTKNGHLLGLHPRLSASLLEYCNDMGITQIMRELTMDSRDVYEQDDFCSDIDIRLLQEYDWFIQRVDGCQWQSDMHWLSPSDAKSVEHYLQAFSQAGFDDVLKTIGEHFGYTGLVAYHMSVIAVSHCTSGSLHVDVTGTGDKSINVIIPLVRYQV